MHRMQKQYTVLALRCIRAVIKTLNCTNVIDSCRAPVCCRVASKMIMNSYTSIALLFIRTGRPSVKTEQASTKEKKDDEM